MVKEKWQISEEGYSQLDDFRAREMVVGIGRGNALYVDILLVLSETGKSLTSSSIAKRLGEDVSLIDPWLETMFNEGLVSAS